MKIGIISSTKHHAWNVTDEVWHRVLGRALERGDQAFVAAAASVIATPKVGELRQRGVGTCMIRPFRPTRLYLRKERIWSELRALERFAPDVVLLSAGSFYDPCYQPALAYFCARTPFPVVLLGHAHSEFFPLPDRAELTRLFSRLAGMIFVAEGNRTIFRMQFGTDLTSTWVARNTPLVAPTLLQPATSGTTHFLCPARLDCFLKGHDILLATLATPAWRDRDWHLHLCGAGPDRAVIEGLVAAHRLLARVTVHGLQSDMKPFWQQNHAMLLASRGEGLANAVLEAMAFGRIAVATDVGGHREVIDDGVDGFLAEAATPHSFSTALERAWSQRERWPEIGRAAHARMNALAATNREGQILAVLDQCAASGRRST